MSTSKTVSKNSIQYALGDRTLYRLYIRLLLCAFLAVVVAVAAFADTLPDDSRPACSRVENGRILYYASLNEAFEAAAGSSPDAPDEITLLADLVLDTPIVIKDARHIRLKAGGERTLWRGSGNIEYPLFVLSGKAASLSLGTPETGGENSLVIDGGYLNSPPVEARSPLIAVNGPHSQLIMHGNVTLQNNYNTGDGDGTSPYQNGAGVYIRTDKGSPEIQAEFIMKGGTIRGNINNTQNPVPCGGGVYISGFGLFVMEGGTIMGNTAFRSGGGFHTGSRGSFKKTGGIIYGENAPPGYRNTAVNGVGDPVFYGHAVCVALTDKPMARFRNDSVMENDFLSYTGSATANGVFGRREQWSKPNGGFGPYLIVGLLFLLASGVAVCILIAGQKARSKKAAAAGEERDTAAPVPPVELSPREREVMDLLFSELATKQIAHELGLTYSGVHFHIQKLYGKLGVKSRTELLIKFRQN